MYVDMQHPCANKIYILDLDTGEKIRDCFTADDETGFYRVYKRNAEGNLYKDSSGTEVAKETRRGNIAVRILHEKKTFRTV